MPDANDKIAAAIDRLNSQLPLLARQQALPPGLVAAHRAILLTLAEEGPALTNNMNLASCPQGLDPVHFARM